MGTDGETERARDTQLVDSRDNSAIEERRTPTSCKNFFW